MSEKKKSSEEITWKLVSGSSPIERKNPPDIIDIFDKIDKAIHAIVRLLSLKHKGHVYILLKEMSESIEEFKIYYGKQEQEP